MSTPRISPHLRLRGAQNLGSGLQSRCLHGLPAWFFISGLSRVASVLRHWPVRAGLVS